MRKIILFYMNGITKPIAYLQDGPWCARSMGGPPLFNVMIRCVKKQNHTRWSHCGFETVAL